MTPRRKRLILVLAGLVILGVAANFVRTAFKDNLVFFYTPSDIAANHAPQNKAFRIGGMVREGSLKRDGVKVAFVVTDTVSDTPVQYEGILPDLFRQGKGVVCQGKIGPDGVFHASEVLAKHDENYMPPEAGKAIEQAQKMQKTIRVQ